MILVTTFFTSTFSATIDVNCETSDKHEECLVTNLKRSDNELNFLTNTNSFRDSKIKLTVRESFLKKIPSEIFTAYKNLQFSSFADCDISQIDESTFKDAHNLKELTLWINKISFLENSTFDGVENLEYLNLAWNRIESLTNGPFNKLIKLRELDLSDNKLKSLDETTFSSLKSLVDLRLSNNKLSVISPNIYGAENLELLDLSRNGIEHLPNGVFNKLTKLKDISLNDNKIRNLDETTFSSLRQLAVVMLGKNGLTVVNPNIFLNNQISQLDLSNNQLTDVDDLIKNLNQLTVLQLSWNRIRKLDNYPETVTQLLISHNKLTKLFINKNVELLFASNNEITEISGKSNKIQSEFYLAANKNLSAEEISKVKLFGSVDVTVEY